MKKYILNKYRIQYKPTLKIFLLLTKFPVYSRNNSMHTLGNIVLKYDTCLFIYTYPVIVKKVQTVYFFGQELARILNLYSMIDVKLTKII